MLADWKLVLVMGGAAIAAVAMIVYAFLRPEGDPEDQERRRRSHLTQISRIAESQAVDLAAQPPEPNNPRNTLRERGARPPADLRPRHLVSHTHAISGVTYH